MIMWVFFQMPPKIQNRLDLDLLQVSIVAAVFVARSVFFLYETQRLLLVFLCVKCITIDTSFQKWHRLLRSAA